MRKEYKDELKELTDKMNKAEKFAEKVPMFSEQILENKYTGEEVWLKYINHYKKVRTYNGIARGYFKTNTSRCMTNNREFHEGYFWTVYINTLCEYNSHANYGLEDICRNTSVYYYDNLNSKFYCTDEEIEGLLEALNAWVIKAKKQAKNDSISDDIREAEEELRLAQEKIDNLKRNY